MSGFLKAKRERQKEKTKGKFKEHNTRATGATINVNQNSGKNFFSHSSRRRCCQGWEGENFPIFHVKINTYFRFKSFFLVLFVEWENIFKVGDVDGGFEGTFAGKVMEFYRILMRSCADYKAVQDWVPRKILWPWNFTKYLDEKYSHGKQGPKKANFY